MKSVLITGASRGYGLELTRVFAENGWRIYATCRKVEDFPSELKSQNVEVLPLDVSSEDSINQLAKTLDGKPIDVLINNAGIYDAPKASAPMSPQNMDSLTKIYQINTIGPRLVAEALTPNLELGQLKTVVNISSYMSSFELANSFNMSHWPYCSSKAAMNYAMLAFANQNPNLKVTLIHPGWMRTEMGGDEAGVDPSQSANQLFNLINSDLIKPSTLTDTKGSPIHF